VVGIGGAPCLYARCLGIVIPHELRGFHGFGEQSITDGCRRPGERDPRDADFATNSLAPFPDLCYVCVGLLAEPLEPRAELLQFATLTDAVDEGLPVDYADGF
jgi:hypothetical protein